MFRPWENHINQYTDNKLEKNPLSTHNQLDLNAVLSYIIEKMYFPHITNKNVKSNFRKQCKPYTVDKKKKLYYKKKNRNILFLKSKEKLLPVVIKNYFRTAVYSCSNSFNETD